MKIESTCPLCNRLLTFKSMNSHHLVPKTFGGKETIDLHRMCHGKLHSVFTEREMKNYYHTIERILENEEIQTFVKWISKKEPDFYSSNRDSSQRKGKRRR